MGGGGSVGLVLEELLLLQAAVLAATLLGGAGGPLALQVGDLGGAAGGAMQLVVESLGQQLAGSRAVLAAGARRLGLDDDARGQVLELDGRVGFVLGRRGVSRGRGTWWPAAADGAHNLLPAGPAALEIALLQLPFGRRRGPGRQLAAGEAAGADDGRPDQRAEQDGERTAHSAWMRRAAMAAPWWRA